VPLAYATGEPHARSLAVSIKHLVARLNQPLYCRWLRHCHTILADTEAHADLSARVNHVPRDKYCALPVGTDEKLFVPLAHPMPPNPQFRVFYYSSGMQPLHGVPVVLAAAERLQANPNIEFFLVGGRQPMAQVAEVARQRGANVHYVPWIPFDDLVTTIHSASLCLGGPFGDTQQARHVITGKTYQFLACGAPTVVGAGLATGELFRDKHNCLLGPQGDVDALVSAISWAYDNPAELHRIGQAGRQLYEQKFSTAAIAHRLRPLLAKF
jgi:glycosyltransferase involved in cell wall biosynthesis